MKKSSKCEIFAQVGGRGFVIALAVEEYEHVQGWIFSLDHLLDHFMKARRSDLNLQNYRASNKFR